MRKERMWLSALRGVSKDALYWFLWNGLGSLFPVVLGLMISVAISQTPRLSDYSKDGQFFLYCVAFLGSSFFIINKSYRHGLTFPLRSLLTWIIVFFWATSSAMFALMIICAVNPIVNLNREFIQGLSYVLYIVSFAMGLIVASIDLHYERRAAAIDVPKEISRQIDNLSNEVKKLGGDQ